MTKNLKYSLLSDETLMQPHNLIFGSDPFKKFEHDPPNANEPFVLAPRGKQGKIKKRVHFSLTISRVSSGELHHNNFQLVIWRPEFSAK
jgi:hypothetical protein